MKIINLYIIGWVDMRDTKVMNEKSNLKVPNINNSIEVITPDKEFLESTNPINLLEDFYNWLLEYLSKETLDSIEQDLQNSIKE
jgi:hypothetical protein